MKSEVDVECKIFKQSCNTDELCINRCKKPIEQITDVFKKLFIESYKIISTCSGNKLVIKGYKLIKIHYMSQCYTGTLSSACFIIPFCEFIEIKYDNIEICKIDGYIEYCEVDKLSPICICLSTLICLCIIFKEKKCNITNQENNCTDYHFEFLPNCDLDEYFNEDIEFKNDWTEQHENLYINNN